ncbi:MAG: ArnT family glycosyltransferase [Anaerolineales bacterium]
MSERKRWLALYVLGLVVYGVASLRVQSPGYMDADYYYATALQLVDGKGLSEPFLWNYLDDPTSLPHTSHLYWMPLPTVLSAGSMLLLGSSFRAAQIPFILLAAALSPLAASFAQRLSRDGRLAWMAGLFALSPGFFLPFLVTIDSFALFAIAGSLSLWLMARAVESPSPGRWLMAGLLIGLGSLARADGLLLFVIGALAVIWSGKTRISGGVLLFLGLLAVMGPWWARNVAQTGTALNSGSQRLLWMLNYDDLFAFPASQLTLARWWEAGLLAAASARLAALATNLQRLIAEAGIVFLAPFMAVGAARKWDHPFVRLGIGYLAMLFMVMTFVFPFVGPRGALFHSMVAVVPMLWALAPIGLKAAIYWLGSKRKWNQKEAWRVLGTSAVVMAAVLTVGLYANRFLDGGNSWNASAETYRTVAAAISDQGESVVAVNNPPGFFAHSQQPAVVIPNGTDDALHKVVDAYAVRWVVLEANHPQGLDSLYSKPESVEWLRLYRTIADGTERPVYVLEVVR